MTSFLEKYLETGILSVMINLSAYAEDHACVPKHLEETFRQREALRRAGTGSAGG
jgi:hypothetical protein